MNAHRFQQSMAVAALAMALLGSSPQALGQGFEVVTEFQVDSTRSTVGIFGGVDLGGFRDIEPQFPGSLTSPASGTLSLIRGVDHSGPKYLRIQGANLQSQSKPGPFLPGNGSAHFAGKISDLLPGIDAFAVIDDPTLDISLPVGLLGSTGSGEFTLQNARFDIVSGDFRYDISGLLAGTIPLTNLAEPSPSFGSIGRLTKTGTTATLELNFQAVGQLYGTLIPDIRIGVEGTIVATASLAPEPIQWGVADGGNGNFYTVVSDPLNWQDAKEMAESLTHLGRPGQLVSIESIAENLFLTETFGESLHYKWISGFQPDGSEEPDGGWTWINGEPVLVGDGTPAVLNNIFGPGTNENRLVFDGDVGPYGKSWNDLPGQFATNGYVVEFTAVPEASSVILAGLASVGFTTLVAMRHRRVRNLEA